MGIRQVPSNIKDPNLHGFLRELRSALGNVTDQVARIVRIQQTTPGSDSGDPGNPSDPGNPGDPGTPTPTLTPTITVLSVDPVKPVQGDALTLTAQVSGNNPTGAIRFVQNGEDLGLVVLEAGTATYSIPAGLDSGLYTFQAFYLGDSLNYPSTSNVVTVEIGSIWDGPPPSVTTLVTLSGIGYIVLKWTMPYVGDLDTIEIWGSQSNDRATATKLGESNGSLFVYTPPANQPAWYFWARVRDAEGLFSDYFPNTTPGVLGTALSLEDEIAGTPLWQDLGDRLDAIDVTIDTRVSQLQGQIDEVLGAPEYNAATTYQTDDIVKYNNSIYRALQTTTGNLPTNTTYWQLIGNYTSIGDAVAAHTNQISTLNTGLTAEVSARETLATRVTTAEGNITTQAGYINNRYTKAEVDSAMASQLTGITASYQAADLANLNSAKTYSDAAVSTEATARASADSSLASQISTVSATAGAKNRTYRQAAEPTTGMTAGDIWFDSDDNNKAYRYDGSTWVVTDDTRIAANSAAIQTEATARATADSSLATQIDTVVATANSKNKTYRQAAEPTSGMTAGDVWYDSDDNNKAYRYNGTIWVVTDDTRIAQNAAAIQTETTARANADSAMASQITTLQTSVAGNTATLQTQAAVIDGVKAQYMVKTDVNGLVSGFGLFNDGEVSDFFIRADRFAVGNPALMRTGTCSIAEHTTATACKAAGGTWTWTDANATNIPFIVYSTQQTISAPDGSGKTLTIEPGVYMKTANIQKAFVGDAEIYGDLKSYSWAAAGGPNTFPFNGWKLDKASNLALYGGSFALYDEYGNPVIQSGKIEFNQFKRLIVSASSELFTIPKPPNTAVTPSTITLNTVLQNISGVVTWTVTSGTYGGTLGTGQQKIIDPAQMTSATVTFKASMTISGVLYEDSVTLAKVQDGSDSLWLYLDNEAHLVPADSSGTVTSYAGAQTGVKVYRGAVDVTSSEGWTISAASYTGLSGAPDVVSQTVGFVDGSPSMTADVATITVRASKSGQANLDRIFTVSKAKQGIQGVQGPAGGSGIVIDLNNDSHLVPTDFDGLNGNFSGCASTASIFEGASETSATWAWSAPAVTGGITGTASNNNRTYTVAGMTSTTGTVTFSATKSGLAAQTIVFSVTKVRAGTPGTSATVYSLTSSVAAIKKAGDSNTFTPGSVTFTATSVTGNAAPVTYTGGYIRIQTSTDGANWTNYLSADEATVASARTYPKTGSIADATVKFVRGILSTASTFTTTLDTESVPVIADGATGAQGATGLTGQAGVQGPTGPAGPTLYTWIAYSNFADGANPNTGTWNGEAYIGLANNKTVATESTSPADYTWSLIKGDQGVPGTPGANGQPTYTWFAYANDATGSTGFTTGPWTNQTYVGIAANKLTETESQDPTLYTWSKIQGAQGPAGSNGLNSAVIYLYRRSVTGPALPTAAVTYTFSTKATTGLTNSWTTAIPAGTDPIWVTAATASSATDTDTIATNEWAAATVLAQNGTNGVNGVNGIDGLNSATVYIYRRSVTTPPLPSATTTYTFATKALTGLNNTWSTTIQSGTDPIWASTATAVANTASDTILATEWATPQILAQNGAPGLPGATGPSGIRGSVSAYITTFTDVDAWNAILAKAGSTPVPGDYVETQAGQRHAYTAGGYPGTWTSGQSVAFSGTVIVDGTLTSNKIAAGAVTAEKLAVGVAGKNLLHNSGPARGGETTGWTRGWYTTTQMPSAATAGFDVWRPYDTGSVYVVVSGLVSTGQEFDLNSTFKIPVTPGQRYEASAYLSVHRCNGDVGVIWYNAAGVQVAPEPHGNLIAGATGSPTAQAGGVLSNWPRSVLFADAPATAAYAVFFCRGYGVGESLAYLFATHMYFGSAANADTAARTDLVSPWSPATFQTVIDGSGIRTGSITADLAVIADGAITNAKIGNFISSSVAGSPTFDAAGNLVTVGSEGWGVGKQGNAVFNSVIVRDPTKNIVNGVVGQTGGATWASIPINTGSGVGYWTDNNVQYTIAVFTYNTLFPSTHTAGYIITLSTQCPLNLRYLGLRVYHAGGTATEAVYDDVTSTEGGLLNARSISGTRCVSVNARGVPFDKTLYFEVLARVGSGGTQPFGGMRLSILETYR